MQVITERAVRSGHWGCEVTSSAEQSVALADDSVHPRGIIAVWILRENVLVSGAVSSSYRSRPAYFFARRMVVTPNPILNPSARQKTQLSSWSALALHKDLRFKQGYACVCFWWVHQVLFTSLSLFDWKRYRPPVCEIIRSNLGVWSFVSQLCFASKLKGFLLILFSQVSVYIWLTL